MQADVHLQYVDSVHVRVRADPSILYELAERFTFKAENYKFHPAYKTRRWDGNISLVNRLTGLVYAGLAHQIKKFCDSNEYTFTFDEQLVYDNVSLEEVREHIESLNLPDWLDTRDYQIESVAKCLRTRRRTLISPTSSGKSLMIYLLHMWYANRLDCAKSLLIVPNVGLVGQFESDLRSYGFTGKIETSVGGLLKDNDIDADVVITTWQALDNGKKKMPEEWFNQFTTVFGDEAHGAKATLFIKIMSAMKRTPYRFGTTGTLGDVPLNRTTIEGLFGPIYQSTTTRELIDQGFAADIKIKCIILKYPEEVRKEFHKKIKDPKTGKMRGKTYQEEIEFITEYKKRTNFIKHLTLSLKGNKLVFFRIIEHGKAIHESFGDADNVFYIDGGVKDREKIRKAINEEENAILVASLGTTSTGVSINRLHYMIAASPSKSKIKVLQSIGRMLRQHEEKTHAVLFDIVDDLSWKNKKNYTFGHFEDRVKIYDSEQFSWKLYHVGLK